MACVVKRRGKWVIDYRDTTGKRKWKTIDGTRQDADDELARIIGGGRQPTDTKRKVKEYGEEWLDIHGKTDLKESTAAEYKMILDKHIFPAFGHLLLSKLTRQMVRRFIKEKIDSGLSRARVQSILVPLRAMYNTLVDDGLLPFNPVARTGKFNKRRGDERKISPLTRDELTVMLGAAREHFPHYYPLLLCAARTGMREGELFGLRWQDIDFNGRFIEVRRNLSRGKETTPKNGKTRKVDMSTQLADTLERKWAEEKAEAIRLEGARAASEGRRPDYEKAIVEAQDGRVFTTPRGNELVPQNFLRYVFSRVLEKAELRRIRFHDLRHSFASLLIQQGESLAYVKDQLGHHSIQITVDTYGHLVPGGNRQAVDRLDDTPNMPAYDPRADQDGSKMVADAESSAVYEA